MIQNCIDCDVALLRSLISNLDTVSYTHLDVYKRQEQSLRDMIEQRIGIRVLLENDTRARCYACLLYTSRCV